MKMKILLPFLAALTLSACNEQESEVLWLKKGAVFVHVEGTKDRFYPETEYLIDESCKPNEVMVRNNCVIAIFVEDVMEEGFSVAAIPTETPEQFTLRVSHDKHRPLNIQIDER